MFLTLYAALLFASAPATVDSVSDNSSGATVQSNVKKPKKPKLICRDNPATTGSRMAKRICKTQEQWDSGSDDLQAGVRSDRPDN